MKKKTVAAKALLIISALSAILFLIFQNCSEVKIQTKEQEIGTDMTLPELTQGEWDLCPEDHFSKSDDFYPSGNKNTSDSGPLGNGDTLVIKFIPKERPYLKLEDTANFSNVYGGPAIKEWSVSKTACDFSEEGAVINHKGQKLFGRSLNGDFQFSYTYGSIGSGATFLFGEVYYLNIYGVSGCATADCHLGPIRWY